MANKMEQYVSASILACSSVYNIFHNEMSPLPILSYMFYLYYASVIICRNIWCTPWWRERGRNAFIIAYSLCSNLIVSEFAIRSGALLPKALILLALPCVYVAVRLAKYPERDNKAILDVGHILSLVYLTYSGYMQKNILALYVSAVFLIMHYSAVDVTEGTSLLIMTCANVFGGLLINEMGTDGGKNSK